MRFDDKFLKNNMLVFLGTSVGSLTNLLYQLLIVRRLTVASYGVFNSLMSFFTIFSLPLASLATMVAKYTASYNHTGERKKADALLLVVLKHIFLLGFVILAVYFIFGFNLRSYLKIESAVPVYLTGAMLFFTLLSTVMLGGLQGLEKFAWFSASSICNGLLKLSLTAVLLFAGWDLFGALDAYLIAQIVTLFVTIFALREIIFVKDSPPADLHLKEKYKFILPSLLTLGCIAVLTNSDVILVKHFFTPVEAGQYSIAQIVGKVVLFIPGAMYIVILPSASGLDAQKKDPRHLLKRALKYAFALCAAVLIVYNIFPGRLLQFLTGKSSDGLIFLGRLFSVAMMFLSLVIILLLYQLSVSRFKFLKSLVALSLLQVLAIWVFHATLAQVLSVLILNGVLLFILNVRAVFTGSAQEGSL